jgi:hypothetical protein
MRVLAPTLSYMHDGLEELAAVSRDASLPVATRLRLERVRNTLEGVYQLQDRRCVSTRGGGGQRRSTRERTNEQNGGERRGHTQRWESCESYR